MGKNDDERIRPETTITEREGSHRATIEFTGKNYSADQLNRLFSQLTLRFKEFPRELPPGVRLILES